jgi:Na+/H+ antiporter NhaD/arsenite permease-like protein
MHTLTLIYQGNWPATLIFIFAVLHSFFAGVIHQIGEKYSRGTILGLALRNLGEIEIAFGLWACIYILITLAFDTPDAAKKYFVPSTYSAPLFVFAIMATCSTKPITYFAQKLIDRLGSLTSTVAGIKRSFGDFVLTLTIGPLLGSFITEPAAMTVTALILSQQIFSQAVTTRFKYATIGLLFVNVSIGGTLTPYAAPPILMVAKLWGWNIQYMLFHFGWKAIICIVLNTVIVALIFRKELFALVPTCAELPRIPSWIIWIHFVLLFIMILNQDSLFYFMGAFCLLLGLVKATVKHQTKLKLRESLMVAFFLGGIIVLGEPQRWWLAPILKNLDHLMLYLGATATTGIVDNALLTFLASQIPDLSNESRYLVTAGSIIGGGLTVIANAPNLVGYRILVPYFGPSGVRQLKLFTAALPLTAMAALLFWILR